MNVLVLGSSGYIGSAFVKELQARGISYAWLRHPHALSYGDYDLANPNELVRRIRQHEAGLVINCAAFIPPESVALCDQNQAQTILSNVLLPMVAAQACQQSGIPFAHISTGCLWSDGQEHAEDDPPQRAFNGHCGFYIGTKVLAEESVRANCEQHYIWRVRLPFDEMDHPRNYLSKLARFEEVFDHDNTICHRGDFVKACLDLWQMRADWGTYHVANSGSLKATDIVSCLYAKGIRTTIPKIVEGPQGGSRLSVKKMEKAGVRLRPVEEAVAEAINNWKTNVSPAHEMPRVR